MEVKCCEGDCIKSNAVITDEKISKKILDKIIDRSKDIKKKIAIIQINISQININIYTQKSA